MSTLSQQVSEGYGTGLDDNGAIELTVAFKPFRFTDLPREIRHVIYEFYFERYGKSARSEYSLYNDLLFGTKRIEYWRSHVGVEIGNLEHQLGHRDLFYVSKYIYTEALEYYFSTVMVRFTINGVYWVNKCVPNIRVSSTFAYLQAISLRIDVTMTPEYHSTLKDFWKALGSHPRIRFMSIKSIWSSRESNIRMDELNLWFIQKMARLCVSRTERRIDFQIDPWVFIDDFYPPSCSLLENTSDRAKELLRDQKQPVLDKGTWAKSHHNNGHNDQQQAKYYPNLEAVLLNLPVNLRNMQIGHGKDESGSIVLSKSQFQALMEFTIDGWCFEAQRICKYLGSTFQGVYRLKWVKDGKLGKISPSGCHCQNCTDSSANAV